MSITTANQPRVKALKAARAKDSELKRRRALAALQALEASGASITFTAVAKAAGVSTWLVYAEGIREHIDAARHRQAHHGAAPAPTPSAKRTTASDSLRTDLAIAQEQIKTLRAERDKLQQRLRLQLGAELEAPDRAHLTARVADLEAINRNVIFKFCLGKHLILTPRECRIEVGKDLLRILAVEETTALQCRAVGRRQ